MAAPPKVWPPLLLIPPIFDRCHVSFQKHNKPHCTKARNGQAPSARAVRPYVLHDLHKLRVLLVKIWQLHEATANWMQGDDIVADGENVPASYATERGWIPRSFPSKQPPFLNRYRAREHGG